MAMLFSERDLQEMENFLQNTNLTNEEEDRRAEKEARSEEFAKLDPATLRRVYELLSENEESCELSEVIQKLPKKFVKAWGQTKLLSELKKRQEALWWLRVKRSIEKLDKEYLQQKAAKKIRKRKEKGWAEVHREMIGNS